MEILIFLIPLALILGGFFIGSCLWAIREGQFDDLDTPARRILLEDINQMKKESNDHE